MSKLDDSTNIDYKITWTKPKGAKIDQVDRPQADEYFLKIAFAVAERATCRRHHCGAVIVKNRHILATGYNGAPAGMPDCLELGCLRDQLGIKSGTRHEICRAIHAEQNAIIQCAVHNASTDGATIYCTHTPCILCAKNIINARIKRFVTCSNYPDKSYVELFEKAGVEIIKMDKPNLQVTELE